LGDGEGRGTVVIKKFDVFFSRSEVSIPLQGGSKVEFVATQNSTLSTSSLYSIFTNTVSLKRGARFARQHIISGTWHFVAPRNDEILVQWMLFSFVSCEIVLPDTQ
jgi:hypothetical protein